MNRKEELEGIHVRLSLQRHIDPERNLTKNLQVFGMPLMCFEVPGKFYVCGAFLWGLFYCFAIVYGVIWPRGFMSVQSIATLVIFAAFGLIFSWCYLCTVLSEAGGVPDNFIRKYGHAKGEENRYQYCTVCQLYKPPRAHHCRRCGKCSLFMDHHCVWLDNCIGHRNYKYFFCTLFYCFLADLYLAAVIGYRWAQGPIAKDYHTLTLAVFSLLVVVQIFMVGYLFFFHCYFVCTNITTLDWFCCRGKGPNHSFDYGLLENIRIRLGSNPLLWLVPLPTAPYHDGVSFRPTNPPDDRTSINPTDERDSLIPREPVHVHQLMGGSIDPNLPSLESISTNASNLSLPSVPSLHQKPTLPLAPKPKLNPKPQTGTTEMKSVGKLITTEQLLQSPSKYGLETSTEVSSKHSTFARKDSNWLWEKEELPLDDSQPPPVPPLF